MGNQKQNAVQESLNCDWILVKQSQSIKLYAHKFSHDLCSLIKLYNVDVHELEIYSSRKQYSFAHTPMIYGYHIFRDPKDSIFISSGQTVDIEVLAQSTHEKLSDYNPINMYVVEEGFLLRKFQEILLGFQFLFNKYGAFKVNHGQIGWTSNHIIKVWLHDNFAINTPQLRYLSQQEMLKDIFHIFRFIVPNLRHNWTFSSVITQFRLSRYQLQSLNSVKINETHNLNNSNIKNRLPPPQYNPLSYNHPQYNHRFNNSCFNNSGISSNIPIAHHNQYIPFNPPQKFYQNKPQIPNNIRFSIPIQMEQKKQQVFPNHVRFVSEELKVNPIVVESPHLDELYRQKQSPTKAENLSHFQYKNQTPKLKNRKVSLKIKNFDDQFRNTMESVNISKSIYNSGKRCSHYVNEPIIPIEQTLLSLQSRNIQYFDSNKNIRFNSPTKNRQNFLSDKHQIDGNNSSRISSQSKRNVPEIRQYYRISNKNTDERRFSSSSDNKLNQRYANLQIRMKQAQLKRMKKLSLIFQDENPAENAKEKQDKQEEEYILPQINKFQKKQSKQEDQVERQLEDLFEETVSKKLDSQNQKSFHSLEEQLDQMLKI